MQEIAPNIFIETAYPGVTLGAINWPHGLILIDAPFRADDVRTWRSALLNLGGGVDRMLVNLDAHLDRTLGTRAMECTVVGQERMTEIFRNRPVSYKGQGGLTGAEWELYNGIGSVRWLPPEISFTDSFSIYWNESPALIEHCPGPSHAAVWVSIPDQQVLFLGDAVTFNQPPFLAHAHLPTWIELLNRLASPQYRHWIMVSSRGGIVTQDDVRKMLRMLEKVQASMEALAERQAAPDETAAEVPALMRSYKNDPDRAELYQNRLLYGLRQYYIRTYRPTEAVDGEE